MTNTAERLLGSLREEDGKGTVRMEELYPTDINDLWAAISEPKRLAEWLVRINGDTAKGATFTGVFTSTWEGSMRVDVCEAPHRLLITSWDEDGATEMEANLTTEGDGTRLVVEERGLPLNEYAGHGSGWQAHLEDLMAYLTGKPKGDWSNRWRELTPQYVALVAQR